ncbi:putative nuclease HARBI1 [Hordeum vulgare]|nr:putative nuclease HARBI1 [Hordeum vulgare]
MQIAAQMWEDRQLMSRNDLLSIDVDDEDNGEVNTSPNVGQSKHPKGPPKKKAKVVNVLEDPLVTTLNYGFKHVGDALVKSGDDGAIPDELWDEVYKLEAFDEEQLAHYYAHLVDNPKIVKAFMTLFETNKSVWVSRTDPFYYFAQTEHRNETDPFL